MADEPLTFRGRTLPAGFVRRVVVIEPGALHPFVAAEWDDSLVVVERGTVLLERGGGRRHVIHEGDVLWLAGLRLLGLRNGGGSPAVVVAIARD